MNRDTKCFIIAGHYGSGKTEIADNLALWFARGGQKTAIADLDIVNPYFRTRECEEALRDCGVEVVSSNFGASPYEDTPGLAPEIAACFLRTDRINVIDLGGDPAGARVLGRYKRYIPQSYEMWMVVNANRFYTRNAEAALKYLQDIETAAGLKFTGLINNTHCCEDTSVEDIQRGEALAEALSGLTGLPVVASCYMEGLTEEMQEVRTCGNKFPLALMHRPQWMRF